MSQFYVLQDLEESDIAGLIQTLLWRIAELQGLPVTDSHPEVEFGPGLSGKILFVELPRETCEKNQSPFNIHIKTAGDGELPALVLTYPQPH